MSFGFNQCKQRAGRQSCMHHSTNQITNDKTNQATTARLCFANACGARNVEYVLFFAAIVACKKHN